MGPGHHTLSRQGKRHGLRYIHTPMRWAEIFKHCLPFLLPTRTLDVEPRIITKFNNFQIFKFSNYLIFKISKFQIIKFSKFSNFLIFKFKLNDLILIRLREEQTSLAQHSQKNCLTPLEEPSSLDIYGILYILHLCSIFVYAKFVVLCTML